MERRRAPATNPPALQGDGPALLVLPVAVAASALTGALTVLRLPLAIVAVAAVMVAALVALSRSVPAKRAVLLSFLALSATVDLIGQARFGSTSAYAWVTGGVAALLLAALFVNRPGERDRDLSWLTVTIWLFPVFAIGALAWYGPSLPGVQNVLVYAIFAATVVVAMRAASSGGFDFEALRRVLYWVYLAAAALYLASVAYGGLSGGTVIGSRSYALFALTGVAWGAALVRHGYRREIALVGVSVVMILLSLSRLSFAAALVIIALAAFDMRTVGRAVRSVVVVAVALAIGYAAVTWFGPLRERFVAGDLVSVTGDLSLNVSGRTDLWSTTWESARRSLWLGQGPGSAEEHLTAVLGTRSHPHNDFLRLLHDFGLVGVSLFVAGFAVLLWQCWMRLRRTVENVRALHLAAVLELVALAAAMLTDNAVVYLFVVLPVAVIVGTSLGLRESPRGTRSSTVARLAPDAR